jgi:hypothetical protein
MKPTMAQKHHDPQRQQHTMQLHIAGTSLQEADFFIIHNREKFEFD